MATEYYQTIASFVCAGQFAQVVQHFRITDPANPNSFEVATELAKAMLITTGGDNYATFLQPILSEDSFVSSFRARRVSPAPGAEAIRVFAPTAIPGTFSGTLESAGVAGCAIWIPDTNDGLTGRNFFPGVSEEAIDDGYFAAGYVSAFADLTVQLATGVFQTAEGDFALVLSEDFIGAMIFHEIISGYLSPSPGTIRRRRTPI